MNVTTPTGETINILTDKYREKFDGDMPPRHWRYFNSEEPEADVRRWVKSRQIAWAKSKAHA